MPDSNKKLVRLIILFILVVILGSLIRLWQIRSVFVSPIPEDSGIRIIYISPTPSLSPTVLIPSISYPPTRKPTPVITPITTASPTIKTSVTPTRGPMMKPTVKPSPTGTT